MSNRIPYSNLKAVSLGISIGAMTVFLKGAMVMLTVITMIGIALWFFLPEPDRKFLIKLFIAGILLRLALFAIIYIILIFNGGYGDITPDSRLYFVKSLHLLRSWIGKTTVASDVWFDDRIIAYTVEGHLYPLIFFYYLIGYLPDITNPLSLYSDKLINFLFAVLIGIPIFFLVKDIFGKRAAKISAILAVFYPSLILWSMTNQRDTINIFLMIIVAFSWFGFQKKKKHIYFIPLLISVLLLSTIRDTIFYLTLIVVCSCLLLMVFNSLRRKSPGLLLIIVSIFFFIIMRNNSTVVKIKDKFLNFDSIALNLYEKNVAILSQEGSNFEIYEEGLLRNNKVDKLKFFIGAGKGLVFFMLVPFPWTISSMAQLIAYPQVIIWYFLLPFVFIGLIIAIRYKFKESFMMIFYVFFVTVGFALVEGNVGSTLRHRDLIIPFYLIFASVGIVHIFRGGLLVEEKK